MSPVPVPDSIYGPIGSSRPMLRVFATLQLIILTLLGLFLWRDVAGIVIGGAVFAFLSWLGHELFLSWYRRQKRMAYLSGEEGEAVVVAKRLVLRGGYYRLTVEYTGAGRTIRASAAVDDSDAVHLGVGDKFKIRFLRQRPTWWVPSGAK